MKRVFQSSIVTTIFTTLIILGTGLVVFTPEMEVFEKGANFAVYFMLLLFFAGLFFLIINNRRLLLISFGACAVLCLYLRSASNQNLILPKPNFMEQVKVAHVNVSSYGDGYEGVIESIRSHDPDVISFQEVTPDWMMILNEYMSEYYPFKNEMVRIDNYGMMCYSKLPIRNKEVIEMDERPNLLTSISLNDGSEITVFSTYVMPAILENNKFDISTHLIKLGKIIGDFQSPVLNLGEFNLTDHSEKIRRFRSLAGLYNSRRDIKSSWFSIPYDHIFYSEELECTSFQEIEDKDHNHLGIIGQYQFKIKK